LNGTVNFGGPEVLPLAEMAERWLSARPLRKRLLRIPLPGATARAFIAGKNTSPDAERGGLRWQDWLARARSSDYAI
jgi:hypothetical protein